MGLKSFYLSTGEESEILLKAQKKTYKMEDYFVKNCREEAFQEL